MTSLTPAEAKQLGYDAFVYGYPMADNYRIMFKFIGAAGYPFNEFQHDTVLYTPDHKEVVTPNNDTLYSKAWLDLRAGPIVLGVRELDRYWSFQLVDTFTNNMPYVCSRLHEPGGKKFLIAGPSWLGKVPADMELIRVTSEWIFVIGRTEVREGEPVENVVEIMRSYTLTRLTGGAAATRPSFTLPYADELTIKKARYFFEYLNIFLTGGAGPQDSDVDRRLMERLAAIGVGPGKVFDANALGNTVLNALEAGILEADKHIEAWTSDMGNAVNGWATMEPTLVLFGKDAEAYRMRSLVCRAGIYANSPEEAVYPKAVCDADGNPLSGTECYELTFPNGGLPPTDKGFWSVTMYGADRYLVANDKEVYSIGDRSKLVYGKGGSLTIAMQHAEPTRPDVNWLPAPAGPFIVFMRVYRPAQEILDKEYQIPAIRRVNKGAPDEATPGARPDVPATWAP